MPTYLAPFQGITQSAALVEAAAYAPITRVILYTYEIWHPTMAAPVRIVNNPEPITATLEADAPRNPSQAVTFGRSRIKLQRPEEGPNNAGTEVSLRIDNVSGFIADALSAARNGTAAQRDTPWQMIERVYASDDLAAPHRLPVFKVTPIRVAIGGPVAIITASMRRSGALSIPTQTFTPERYPGLQQ